MATIVNNCTKMSNNTPKDLVILKNLSNFAMSLIESHLMKKLLLIIILSIASLNQNVNGTLVHNLISRVTSAKESAVPALLDVTPIDNCYRLSFSLEEYELTEDDIYPGSYMLTIPGFGLTHEPGEPGLPVMYKNLAFLKGSNVKCRLLACDSIIIQRRIAPARPLLSMDAQDYSKATVPCIKRNSTESSKGIVHIEETGMYRGIELANVAICPISYDYETMTVTIYNRFTCELYVDENSPHQIINESGIEWQNFANDPMINQMISESNYSEDIINLKNFAKRIIIVTSTELESALEEFIEWKRREGYMCSLLSYKPGKTAESIREEIAYFTIFHSDLYAIIIVGDTNHIPSCDCNRC